MPSPQLVPPERPVVADASALEFPAGVRMTGAGAEALDSAALARLAELDPRGELQLIHRVMTTFLSSAARLRAQLDAARASGDRVAIRLVAHTLKSSSGYIGALQLARCCAALEAACNVASPATDLSSEIESMTQALETTLAAVSRRLDPR